MTHGFYSDALQPEERELYSRAEIGNIDDEIRLAKVKLHRFVQRAGDASLADLVDGAVKAAEKFGIDFQGKSFDKTEITAAAPDYADLIIRQLDVIRKLELARSQMMLLEKRLVQDEPDDDAPDGFEVVEYEDDDEAT